jgi:hypothetical protein
MISGAIGCDKIFSWPLRGHVSILVAGPCEWQALDCSFLYIFCHGGSKEECIHAMPMAGLAFGGLRAAK